MRRLWRKLNRRRAVRLLEKQTREQEGEILAMDPLPEPENNKITKNKKWYQRLNWCSSSKSKKGK